MGVAGAATASVISAYVGMIVLLLWTGVPSLRRRYRYYSLKAIRKTVLVELLRLSLPNGVATVVVMTGFIAFYWVVGRVDDIYSAGALIGAANQIVIMALMPSFMTSMAFGTATAAIVSQAIGAGRPALANRYAWEAVRLWAYVTWAFGAILFIWPDPVLWLFNPHPEVIEAARDPLRLMALLHGVVAIAMIFAQTLYGLGRANFVLYVETVLHLLVMAPMAYVFGVVLEYGLIGVYIGPRCTLVCWQLRSL